MWNSIFVRAQYLNNKSNENSGNDETQKKTETLCSFRAKH